jgi:penicillin-binding protein 2
MAALAGSMAGVDGRTYSCSPGYVSYGRPIACWKYRQFHGDHGGGLALPIAIKFSCNCFFFKLGNDAGIDRINEAASYFGFGDDFLNPGHSGIEVPDQEYNGYVASKAWWKTHQPGPWTPSETAYISIGQGKMAATPLQICMLGAAIANGGKVYQPTLIDHTEEWQYDRDGQRQKVISKFKGKLRANLLEHGVKKRDMDNMREGMRLVVNAPDGTGKNALSKLWTIAGKTGTAQKKGEGERRMKDDNRTWFMSFAPFEAPKVAVCVMVVNGKAGGSVPAPIAKRVIEQTLSLFPGNEGKYTGSIPKVRPLEPAKGHFNFLEKPAFKDDDANATGGDEEETAAPPDEEEDTGSAAGLPEPSKPAPPKAELVPDDDEVVTETNPKLQPVQFRLKNDPPNPAPVFTAPPVKTR